MRIKNLPSIESMNGSQDALVIEQTDGSEDKSRKVSPAQIKQFIEAGDFEATGEVKDGHGNKLADVVAEIGDLSQTGLTGDSVAEQLGSAKTYVDNAVSRLNNVKNIDEDIQVYFLGYSDIANRVLCPINFPFAFSSDDYTLTCSKIELVGIGTFTSGISVGKLRSSALMILSKTSSAGDTYCGIASIHISRTE